jgi:excisionase family DNA binding protein
MARLREYIPHGLHTTAKVAELLALSERTVMRWMKAGRLERVPLGPRTVRISSTSVNRMIEAQRRWEIEQQKETETVGGGPDSLASVVEEGKKDKQGRAETAIPLQR